MGLPTQKIPITALATSVYSRLTTDSSTSSMSFYSRGAVPSTKDLPYKEIGQFSAKRDSDFSSRDTTAVDITFVIDVWADESSGVGEKPVADDMDTICQALTAADLSVTNYEVFKIWLEYSDILFDVTDATRPVWHGVMRFRVWLAPTT